MAKKRILILIDWFTPAYKAGGPIRSVSNLVEALKNFYNLEILTSAYDLDGTLLNVEVDKWIQKNGFKIFYKTKSKQRFSFCKQILTSGKYDTIYLNSMYSVWFTLVPMLIIRFFGVKSRVVLSPRGMLGRGAVKIKPFKKRVFLFLSRITGLFSKVIWHAASVIEQNDIRRFFGKKAKIFTIPNLVIIPQKDFRYRKLPFPSFVFTGRISSEKNLDFALDILKDLDFSGKLIFHIYGLKEKQDYWEICKNKIHDLKSKGWDVQYKGSVPMTEIPEILNQYHFLFFPSKTENFGHSIAEALANGLPVLISDRTPWRGLTEKKAGFDLPLEKKDLFLNALKELVMFSPNEYKIWSASAKEVIKEFISKQNLIENYKKMFDE